MNIEYIREQIKTAQIKCNVFKMTMTYKEFKSIEEDLNIEFPQHETKIGDLVILKIKI